MFKYNDITVNWNLCRQKQRVLYSVDENSLLSRRRRAYRGDLTISLLDEKAEPAVTWVGSNAYITKVQSTDLKADGNEIAIETAVFVIEKLVLQ